jgi:hypothetical protein
MRSAAATVEANVSAPGRRELEQPQRAMVSSAMEIS